MEPPPTLESLPTEIIHHIVFSFTLPPSATLALAQSSRHFHTTILGAIFSPNPFDTNKHRAQAGFAYCISRGWVKPALLALSRSPTPPTPSEMTRALFFGICNNHLTLVKRVLAHPNTDPTYPQEIFATEWITPLKMAFTVGDIPIISAVLSHPNVRPTDEDLIEAAAFGMDSVVSLILADPEIDPSADDNDAICVASANGHTDVVSVLLSDSRIDPSVNSSYPLAAAAFGNHTEIVNLLLSDPRVSFPLPPPVSSMDVVHALLADPTFDPTTTHNMPLQQSCRFSHTSALSLLLAHPQITTALNNNATIRTAAAKGQTSVVSLLLTHPDTNPAAINNQAIQLAAQNGHVDVVKVLLSDPRVDPSQANAFAETPLSLATQANHSSIITLLTSHPSLQPTQPSQP